jgi:hypothetical protein
LLNYDSIKYMFIWYLILFLTIVLRNFGWCQQKNSSHSINLKILRPFTGTNWTGMTIFNMVRSCSHPTSIIEKSTMAATVFWNPEIYRRYRGKGLRCRHTLKIPW